MASHPVVSMPSMIFCMAVSVSVPQHEEPRHFRAFDGAVKCAERKSARGVLRVDPALM